ncbi:MAG: hypothetical protein M1530_00675 [Candidatus Marsarchaeota archaeon]|nr:hypothetical protein [Candidatus Marsarchaeota archaeon]
MAVPRGKTIKANPELKPSPFPHWTKPPERSPFSKKVWRLTKSTKESAREIGRNGMEKLLVKELIRCAVQESRNGMWRLSTDTFGEAIRLMLKLNEDKALSTQSSDEMWSEISFYLLGAGFYPQARHVIGNIENRWRAQMELNAIDASLKRKGRPKPPLLPGIGAIGLPGKNYALIVPEPKGFGSETATSTLDLEDFESIFEGGIRPDVTVQKARGLKTF